MARFSIIEAATAPDAFAEASTPRAFPDRAVHPAYGTFARTYYPIVHGDALTERSFIVADGEGPLLLVQCALMDGVLSHYGFPIRFAHRPGLGENAVRKSLSAAFSHFDERGAAEAFISGGAADGTLSPVDRACLDRSGQPRLRMRAEADLTLDEDGLRRDVRDSYRSLINWGRRNLGLAYVNGENPDRGLFGRLSDFHAATAGRVVHGEATWSTLFEHVAAGGGEASLGFTEDGELVSGALVIDEADVALYFLAAYDRERFDKPLGHWPLFDSMVRAKARGRRRFDLGEFFAKGSVGSKEFNIGFFKKGFTSRHVTETVWTVPSSEKG